MKNGTRDPNNLNDIENTRYREVHCDQKEKNFPVEPKKYDPSLRKSDRCRSASWFRDGRADADSSSSTTHASGASSPQPAQNQIGEPSATAEEEFLRNMPRKAAQEALWKRI